MSRRPFKELITPFLREKLDGLRLRHGPESGEYQALARQYVKTADEDVQTEEANLRHFEADVTCAPAGPALPGVERLYRRTLVIEPTLACVAHCRYCIRANYPRHNLDDAQLSEIARFCGHADRRDDLREVLVTGGDALVVPDRVDALVRALVEHAPNIRIVRIATRIPVQDPARVDDRILRILRGYPSVRFELATQINHRVELFPEVVDAYRRIMAAGATVYAQNVLLRGVNDDIDALVDLYDELRYVGIESHYLFHCVPLAGMAHLRTRLDEALALGKELTCSGRVSGRAKPMVAAMTDVGKIVLYDGVMVQRDGRHVLLQSNYTLTARRRWNPDWVVPDNVEVDRNGHLRVWYLDGGVTSGSSVDAMDRVTRTDVSERGRTVVLPVMPAIG